MNYSQIQNYRHKLSGMDMTLADYDGRTALHLAAAEGHIHCVNFLLQQCNVPHDARDRWGKSPLEEAVTFGHSAVIENIARTGMSAIRGCLKAHDQRRESHVRL
jgi:ankyrin repeat protein